MQLRSEGSSIRFVAISLLIFTAASFIGYWYWSPYYAADQIKNAIESGDTARMSKFIDFPKVRLNIQRQINNQIDLKLREFQSQPVTTKDIDMIQAELIDCPGYAVEYRVSNPGRDYWAWIRNCDNPTATLQYAGVPGKAIDRVQMRIVEV